MPMLSPSLRGPAVVMGVGGGFAFMGALPVAITMGLGVKTSATIIGMGFIGFGFLLIVPGICWCFVVQHRTYKSWLRKRRLQRGQSREDAPPLCNDETAAVELDAVLISDRPGASYGGTTAGQFYEDPRKEGEEVGEEEEAAGAGNEATSQSQELLKAQEPS